MIQEEQRRDIGKTWDLFYRDGAALELRIPKGPRGKILSGYFTDREAFVKGVLTWNGKVPGLYATINPAADSLLARAQNRINPDARETTSDADITRRRWIPIDIDACRPAGISSTAEEHGAALAVAAQIREWLSSSYGIQAVHADSGNGGHLLISVGLLNDDGARNLVEGFLRAIAARFDTPGAHVDVKCGNAARIWKIYGTLSRRP